MQFVQVAVKRGRGYGRTRSVNLFNSRKVVCVKPLGTRQQGGEQRQSKVRSAAGELFRTRGFDATSVRDIASAAGVSVGTVALAGDKATLFLDVMEENAFALVGGAVERLRSEPVETSLTLAAEIWGVFEPSLTRIAENPELTRAYLIAYLRADGAHATSAGQIDVICGGLAARCVEHSGGEPGVSEAMLAASAIYAVFFSATFALAVGVGSVAEMAHGLRDLITAQTRPFERVGISAGVSL
jgi:AcrR family transcriptional regulator